MSDRSTSSQRVVASSPKGYTPERSRSASSMPRPGLTERERIGGRPHEARKTYPAGRYFTLDNTPRSFRVPRSPRATEVTV